MKRWMRWCLAALCLAQGARAYAEEVVVPAAKVVLFNGSDLSGWVPFPAPQDGAKTWTAAEGVIRCTGKPNGYLRTRGVYERYRLHVEWRWPDQAGNSGVFQSLPGEEKIWPSAIEAQLMAGRAGDLVLLGGSKVKDHSGAQGIVVVPKKEASSEKPVGEWNAMEVTSDRGAIEVWVNGVRQNRATEASVTAGHILLQSEGTPIEFRNVYLLPLAEAPAAAPR